MMITLESGQPIQGSEIVHADLRSSLEPVPMTFECRVKLDESYAPHLLENKILKVGKQQTPVRIVFAKDQIAPWNNGNTLTVRHLIALHDNSAGIATALSRAVIRENVSLSEIYRSCGGRSRVDKDFTVPRFYAYRGNVPSRLIARVCQEHGGVVRWLPDNNRMAFTRIHDLFAQQPVSVSPLQSDATIKSGFLTEHEVPLYISTNQSGAVLTSQVQGARSVVFAPYKTQKQLNMMAAVMLNAKETPCDFAPDIHAGALVRLGGVDMVVITAAHRHGVNETGAPVNQSVFWLGVKGI